MATALPVGGTTPQPIYTSTGPERKFLKIGNQYFEVATFVDGKQIQTTDDHCHVVAGKVQSTYNGLMKRIRSGDTIRLEGTLSSGSSLSECDLTSRGIYGKKGRITTPSYVRPMRDDGNCLFDAIADQESLTLNRTGGPTQLRMKAALRAQSIKEEKIVLERLKPELEEMKRGYEEEEEEGQSGQFPPVCAQLACLLDPERKATAGEMMVWYQRYITENGNWGGLPVLDLFNEYMIEVYQMTDQGVKIMYRTPPPVDGEDKRPVFALWYNGRNHWDSINKDSPFFKEDRRKILEQELEEAQIQQAQEVVRFEELRQHVTTPTGSQ